MMANCMQVSDMVGSLNTSTSMAAFERMEEKVLQMEAEAEAVSGSLSIESPRDIQ